VNYHATLPPGTMTTIYDLDAERDNETLFLVRVTRIQGDPQDPDSHYYELEINDGEQDGTYDDMIDLLIHLRDYINRGTQDSDHYNC